MNSSQDLSSRSVSPIIGASCSIVAFCVDDPLSSVNSTGVIQAALVADDNRSRRDSSISDPSIRPSSNRERNYDAMKIKNFLLNQILRNESTPSAEWW
jgi:hypothetical protein